MVFLKLAVTSTVTVRDGTWLPKIGPDCVEGHAEARREVEARLWHLATASQPDLPEASFSHRGQPVLATSPGLRAVFRWNRGSVFSRDSPVPIVSTGSASPCVGTEIPRCCLVFPHWVRDALITSARLALVQERKVTPEETWATAALVDDDARLKAH